MPSPLNPLLFNCHLRCLGQLLAMEVTTPRPAVGRSSTFRCVNDMNSKVSGVKTPQCNMVKHFSPPKMPDSLLPLKGSFISFLLGATSDPNMKLQRHAGSISRGSRPGGALDLTDSSDHFFFSFPSLPFRNLSHRKDRFLAKEPRYQLLVVIKKIQALPQLSRWNSRSGPKPCG